jgi:hypothetical protein
VSDHEGRGGIVFESIRGAWFAAVAGVWVLGVSAVGNLASADGTDWFEKGRGLLEGAGTANLGSSALSSAEVAAGLKEALEVGTTNVVGQLGQPGGFSSDPKIRIPLPGGLDRVQPMLEAAGMSSMLDDLSAKLNEAAEVATPKAKSLFMDAISAMTLDDAMAILNGPDDSATQYFKGKMSAPLADEMSPIVKESLADVGAVQSYDQVAGRVNEIPFAPKVDTDLTSYVVEKGMDGIFYYLGEQEAEIRRDPAGRGTELLQKVFGSQ